MVALELVENEPKYWDFIRSLRTMKGVREGFIEQVEISPKQQEKYMLKYGKMFHICLSDGEPVGFFGVIQDDIRIATHPNFQGMGVGKFMINKLVKMYPDAFAKVKVDNESSLKLFESCGFKKKYYILEKC